MATGFMHVVVCVDGFIADDNDDVGPLFDWYFNGDMPIAGEAGEDRHPLFRVSARSHECVTLGGRRALRSRLRSFGY